MANASPLAGTISLESCRDGNPIVMTPPYFLDSDQEYLDASGLPNPDPEKHLSYLDIEPRSGVLLRAHKRFQLNVHVDVEGVTNIEAYEHLENNLMLPVIWTDEFLEMDSNNTDYLNTEVLEPLKNVDKNKWDIVGIQL